ncbi:MULTISPECIES: hypothetical protein [unclassified Pseudomonas]|uniref:hypothetical protein n=1 Tax=unclassified Pseudomonas TaxID=196821 RepID=UPI0024475B43|nr:MULTISPECIES: hypothetical protein [unclassified Pseudomonas]MDG9930300.1 hypothetical protein [Pseudomonas sp. GD04042]MDH0484699.1 hypothetical protein [Pseudomonas sp. GD04015]MDH0605778.1 hypothetical protein [Pseudomonas sp. GD03869]
MSLSRLHSRRCLRPRLLRAVGTDVLLPEILAFWALWHCRHARPPDARPAIV